MGAYLEAVLQMCIWALTQEEGGEKWDSKAEFLLLFAERGCVSQTVGVILDDGLICHCEIP